MHGAAASADTTVRLWRFDDGAAAADAGPRYAAEETACLQVLCTPVMHGQRRHQRMHA